MKKAILILSLAMLASCSRSSRKPDAAEPPAVAVRTIAVAPANWPDFYEAVGTVRARATAAVASQVMATVRKVAVQAGDHVQEGQTLVLLDAQDLEAAYRQAEAARTEARSAAPEVESAVAAAKANLDLAQVTFRRMKNLFEKKSISNQEYDEASARVAAAKANYEMAVARRGQVAAKIAQAEEASKHAAILKGYAQIAAPFAGIVTEKSVEPGDLAAPGKPLVTIEREGGYRLEVAVEESRMASIRAGQAVPVTLDALSRMIEGRVSEIVPSVDAASRAFTVKIDLSGIPQLRSGIYGRARFPLGERQALSIPEAAVTVRGQLQSVLVAEEGTAKQRLIASGRKSDTRVEILSGLNAGDQVIFPAPAGLVDGAKVEVRQ